MKRLARRAGVDEAVGFAVSARAWQLLSGPVTQILIAMYFSPQLLGYYVAFLSALAIQLFVELGLHGVLINVASHEWSGMSFQGGAMVGPEPQRSRLLSLSRQSFRWYVMLGVVFCGIAIVMGLWFFGVESTSPAMDSAADPASSDVEISWRLTWVLVVVLSSGHLMLMPLTSILEGCHQLGAINRVRFFQAVAGTLAVWLVMVCGGGLWALVVTGAVRLLGELYIVAVRYRGFLKQILLRSANTIPEPEPLSWAEEVAPLQWRMALQGPLNWLANHLGVLVIFNANKAEAGQLGLTLTVMVSLSAAAAAWMETRRPVLGQLISERRFEELDVRFFRGAFATMFVLTIAVAAFCGVVYALNQHDWGVFSRWAGQMRPAVDCCVLGVGVICQQAAQCANMYVRAHKKEPFLPVAVLVNGSAAVLIFILARQHGAFGYAVAYTLVQMFLQLPCSLLVWRYARNHWRH